MTSALSLLVAISLAVPTPKDSKETETVVAPTGPAPRLLFVKADADGKIRIPVQQNGNGVAVQIQFGAAGAAGGAQVIQQGGAAIAPELKDLKDVAVTTTSGTKVDIAEATRRLAAGGFVLASSDGKAIRPEWLRLFRGDSVLVVASPDLVVSTGAPNRVQIFQGGAGGIGGGAIPIQPLPAPAPKKE
jgi:hypothetical protein